MPAPTQTSKQQQFECQAYLTPELCVFEKEVSHASEGWRGVNGSSWGDWVATLSVAMLVLWL